MVVALPSGVQIINHKKKVLKNKVRVFVLNLMLGYSASAMILFQFPITRSDTRPYIKWAISLVIA